MLVGGVRPRGGVSAKARLHPAAVLEEAPKLGRPHDPADTSTRGHAALVHAGVVRVFLVLSLSAGEQAVSFPGRPWSWNFGRHMNESGFWAYARETKVGARLAAPRLVLTSQASSSQVTNLPPSGRSAKVQMWM